MNRLPALAVLRDSLITRKPVYSVFPARHYTNQSVKLMALNVGHINLKGFTST